MYIIQDIGNITQNATGLAQRKGAAPNTRAQRSASHERHDDIIPGNPIDTGFTGIINGYQVGMVQRSHQARFADETAQEIIIVTFEDLDGHLTSKNRI